MQKGLATLLKKICGNGMRYSVRPQLRSHISEDIRQVSEGASLRHHFEQKSCLLDPRKVFRIVRNNKSLLFKLIEFL